MDQKKKEWYLSLANDFEIKYMSYPLTVQDKYLVEKRNTKDNKIDTNFEDMGEMLLEVIDISELPKRLLDGWRVRKVNPCQDHNSGN